MLKKLIQEIGIYFESIIHVEMCILEEECYIVENDSSRAEVIYAIYKYSSHNARVPGNTNTNLNYIHYFKFNKINFR